MALAESGVGFRYWYNAAPHGAATTPRLATYHRGELISKDHEDFSHLFRCSNVQRRLRSVTLVLCPPFDQLEPRTMLILCTCASDSEQFAYLEKQVVHNSKRRTSFCQRVCSIDSFTCKDTGVVLFLPPTDSSSAPSLHHPGASHWKNNLVSRCQDLPDLTLCLSLIRSSPLRAEVRLNCSSALYEHLHKAIMTPPGGGGSFHTWETSGENAGRCATQG